MFKSRLRMAFLSILAFMFISCANANATTITVVQTYGIAGNPNFREDLTNTLLTATLQFDGSSLSGVGLERLPAQSIDLAFRSRNVAGLAPGLNFSASGYFNFPFEPVGAFEALIMDNNVTRFGLLDNTSGVKYFEFAPAAGSIVNLAYLASDFGQLSLATIGNNPRYNLFPIGGFLVSRTSIVPLPAGLPLLAGGLGLLGLLGWRRKRLGYKYARSAA